MRLKLVPLALVLVAPGAAAQSVWVVDDTPGPGVDFASIQAAVDAASDGDVILVGAGTYTKTSVVGKRLVITADAGQQVNVFTALSVRGLSASQSVVLRGLDVVNPVEQGLYLVDCDGPIFVEDCVLRGAAGDNTFTSTTQSDSFPGARVRDCDEVVFARCTFVGADGLDLEDEDFHTSPGDGGDGLSIELGARVSLFDCDLTGGDGGRVFDTVSDDGGSGGSGVELGAGTLLASGCILRGGKGGFADADIFFCGNGGSGGDGVGLPFGSTGALRWQDCSFAPGVGGGAGGFGCSPGSNGEDVDVDGGSALALPGTARRFAATSPHREGESATLSARGLAGDAVVAALAPGQIDLPLDAFAGSLVIDPLLVLVPLGVVPPSGQLDVLVPIPPAGNPSTLARSIYVQTAHVDGSFALWLGHASALLLLDSTL